MVAIPGAQCKKGTNDDDGFEKISSLKEGEFDEQKPGG